MNLYLSISRLLDYTTRIYSDLNPYTHIFMNGNGLSQS